MSRPYTSGVIPDNEVIVGSEIDPESSSPAQVLSFGWDDDCYRTEDWVFTRIFSPLTSTAS